MTSTVHHGHRVSLMKYSHVLQILLGHCSCFVFIVHLFPLVPDSPTTVASPSFRFFLVYPLFSYFLVNFFSHFLVFDHATSIGSSNCGLRIAPYDYPARRCYDRCFHL